MSLNKLSRADLKAIMQLNEIAAHIAWNHGHKAGDEGADKNVNPFNANPEASEKLHILLSKALDVI